MKTYFNDAVIGNGKVLGCMDNKGQLVRLFWPHIDYPQHIESLQIGIYEPGSEHSTAWLYDDVWEHRQQYIPDTNIVQNNYTHSQKEISVVSTDFVLPHEDVLVRSIEIQNNASYAQQIGIVSYSHFMGSTADLQSTLFDFEADCLVHYRHNYYFSIASNRAVAHFQIGNNPYDAAKRGIFYGIDDIGMTGEAAQSWEMGRLSPSEKKTMHVYIVCAHTLKESVFKASQVKHINIEENIEQTKKYWYNYLKKRNHIDTGKKKLDALYRRSLLVFHLMSDRTSGGLLAAPELDEHFTKCGRYAYCWGRDAAFITSALDMAGYTETVEKFYQWAVHTQNDNGSWHQRYHMDGNLAPCWGLQIDETGTLIWGMLQHYTITQQVPFLHWVWESVKKAADFLVRFIDNENHLPRPTYDLWEERIGQHTYSAAAVHGGLIAAVKIANILQKEYPQKKSWQHVADGIKQAIAENLWDENRKTFFRSLNSTVDNWGFEGHGGKKEIALNPKGYKKWVSGLDIMIDVSLLGVCIPFGVLDFEDERVINTAKVIEDHLSVPNIGGIRRYETDGYMGGNPWILTTLWVALYYSKRMQFEKARNYLYWAADHMTYMGLLPEQVDKHTGQPAWVVPLTWSHAMYVLVYLELAPKGEL